MPDWVYTTLIPGSIVGWFLMLALVSYAGGWAALAREYREDLVTVLERFRGDDPEISDTH